MARENNQKVKLLVLYDMLCRETDEDHPMKTNDICRRMAARGIPCDRRTLAKDIAVLNGEGFEVMSLSVSHSNAYYVGERAFSIPELKILVDAVQAASFIPLEKTNQLIRKISELGGQYQAEHLRKNAVCFNTHKHTNHSVYYTIDFLEKALDEHRKVSFLYFDLNEKGKKIYRKSRKRYVVEPVALVYSEDFYYLLTYNAKYDAATNYRIDRMDHVELENEGISEKALILDRSLTDYTEQVFKMYGGEKTEVTLVFEKSLIGVVFDKFGEDTPLTAISGTECKAVVTVQISPTFFGWVSQFGGKLRMISPVEVVRKYREHCISNLEAVGSDGETG